MSKHLLLGLLAAGILQGAAAAPISAGRYAAYTNAAAGYNVKPAPPVTGYRWLQAKDANGNTYRYVLNDPMHTRFYTLKNGLEVILSPNKVEPRIQTLIAVRAGSKNDPASHTGLAHYLEHMLFKGTDKFGSLNWAQEKPYIDEVQRLYDVYNKTTDPAQRKAVYKKIDSVSGIAAKYAIPNEYDKLMATIGAQGTNAHTSVEETVYEENIPSASLDKFLKIQAERFRNPVFRLFHTELEAVYEEKNRGLDNDASKSYENLLAALFPTHNYGQQTTIGTIEHLKNPSLIAIRDYYNKWYVPNNMAIIMAGDFDPAEVVKKVQASFAYMQPKKLDMYKPAPEKPLMEPVVRNVVGPNAENVMMGYRLPGAANAAAQAPMVAIQNLLSNGKAGLMDIDLNQKQKVLSAGAFLLNMADYSILGFSGRPRPNQSLDDVKALMMAQVDRIKRGDFDAGMLKAIANNARLDEAKALDNNSSRANALMESFIADRGNNWLGSVKLSDELAKLTKADIMRFADLYLNHGYAVVYKRKGVDNSIVKVEKPAITPITLNRTQKSPFFVSIEQMAVPEAKPQFLDYSQAISRGKVGPAQMFYVKNNDSQLFKLHYRYDMGSYNNRLLPLAAAYLEYIGTDKLSAEQISKAFYDIACDFNISAGGEETTVTLSGLQANMPKAAQMLEDLLANCRGDEATFESFKATLLKSRENNKSNKTAIMRGMIQYAIYGKHNPYNYQLSNAELQALKAEDLTNVLHNLKQYEHKVIYYGPLAMANAETEIAALHKLPAAFSPNPKGISFSRPEQDGRKVLFANYDMVQAEIYWVRNGDVFNPGLAADVRLFNNYFGGGMGSVVFQTIRESKALAYSTFAGYNQPEKKGERYTTVAYVGTQADKMADAIAGMNELLTELPEADILLNNAKKGIRQDIETERITKDAIVFNYLNALKYGYTDDVRRDVYDKVNKMTIEDLKAFHKKNLSNKDYTYCVLASDKRVDKAALSKYGKVETLSLEDIFGY